MVKSLKYKITLPIDEEHDTEQILYFKTSKEVIDALNLGSYSVLYNLSFREGKNQMKFKHQKTKHLENIKVEKINLNSLSTYQKLPDDVMLEKKKQFLKSLHELVDLKLAS